MLCGTIAEHLQISDSSLIRSGFGRILNGQAPATGERLYVSFGFPNKCLSLAARRGSNGNQSERKVNGRVK
jgi:hypothetical protein